MLICRITIVQVFAPVLEEKKKRLMKKIKAYKKAKM
jgi:hypothetical protein